VQTTTLELTPDSSNRRCPGPARHTGPRTYLVVKRHGFLVADWPAAKLLAGEPADMARAWAELEQATGLPVTELEEI